MKKKIIIAVTVIMLSAGALIGGAYATGTFGTCPQNSECTTPCEGCPGSGGCGGSCGHH